MTLRSWTRSQLTALRRDYARLGPQGMADALGKTYAAVQSKAHKLGITVPRFWTPGDIALLRASYGTVATMEIARCLDRTIHQVYNQAHSLGLTIPKRLVFRNGGENLLRHRHAEGWTDNEIASELKVERGFVSHMRRHLGLPSNRASERTKARVRAATVRQCEAAGVANLAELRSQVFHQRATASGWPICLRPVHVRILDVLWEHGPMTRREIAAAAGFPWKGSGTMGSRDPGGGLLPYLLRLGLVIKLASLPGKGRGRHWCVYSLPLWLKKGNVDEPECNGMDGAFADGGDQVHHRG